MGWKILPLLKIALLSLRAWLMPRVAIYFLVFAKSVFLAFCSDRLPRFCYAKSRNDDGRVDCHDSATFDKNRRISQ
ncbi:hypothetical protein [Helicobacter sp. T3_23-1056]